MTIKQGLFGMVGTFLGCSIATAGDMGLIFRGVPVVVSVQGGYASINVDRNAHRFMGTDSDVFTYTNFGSARNAGFIGVFLGEEYALPRISRPGFFMHVGVEYNYFSRVSVQGINTVGVEPQTSTTYHYDYNYQTQQVLGMLRLFATTYERFHPYGEVGLGAAFNQVGQYNATTTETDSINLTPVFGNQNQVKLSYSLGLGVDTQINTKIRLALGYRYSNFCSMSLTNGRVIFNNYQSPVSFALGSSNTYANQFIARISYLI